MTYTSTTYQCNTIHSLTGRVGLISTEHWWQKNLFGRSTAASAIFVSLSWSRNVSHIKTRLSTRQKKLSLKFSVLLARWLSSMHFFIQRKAFKKLIESNFNSGKSRLFLQNELIACNYLTFFCNNNNVIRRRKMSAVIENLQLACAVCRIGCYTVRKLNILWLFSWLPMKPYSILHPKRIMFPGCPQLLVYSRAF